MTRNILTFTAICGLIFAGACNPSQPTIEKQETADSLTFMDTTIIEDGGIPIFYNMYLSVEMSSLFKSINATFNKNLLNPYDKSNEYEISGQKAVNLGVYAVDLSYSRAFDQIEHAGNYLKAMHKLASELGIPEDKFYLSVKRIEQNVSNKDSLVKIANELYTATETYLKDSERASTASLVVLGGWTEALHIATNIVNKKEADVELLERIADQKESLVNLMELLNKYSTDKNVTPYLGHLNKLSESFKVFTVDENNLEATYKQLAVVSSDVQTLRKEIIN